MNIDLNKFTKEELLSMINDGLDHAKEQRLEIERLNNIIKEAIEYLKEECLFDGKSYCSDLCYDDIPELVNILNGENNENISSSK